MTIQEDEDEVAVSQPREGRLSLRPAGFALAGLGVSAFVTYGLIQAAGLFTSPAGFRNGQCTPGALTDSARNGDYGFQTSGVIDLQNEFLVVSRRGARLGDRLEAGLQRLGGVGRIGLISEPGEIRDGANDIVFRVPVYKPAGEGCWRVDVSDARGMASYVVQVRER